MVTWPDLGLGGVVIFADHAAGGAFSADGSQAGRVPDRVGAEYCVTSCDLGIFVEEAAESVSSDDLDVGVGGIG